jgi:hypothetical protein
MQVKVAIIALTASLLYCSALMAADTPSSPPKHTIPGTGGYIWGSGPPATPHNTPPASGGSIGVQYPSDKGPTKTRCTRNGVEVPC